MRSLGAAPCIADVAFLREPRRFSTVSRQLQEAVLVAVVVAVAVAVAVAGVIPLVAAVRLRCVLCALCGEPARFPVLRARVSRCPAT